MGRCEQSALLHDRFSRGEKRSGPSRFERARLVLFALLPVYVAPGKAHTGPLSTSSLIRSPSSVIRLMTRVGVRFDISSTCESRSVSSMLISYNELAKGARGVQKVKGKSSDGAHRSDPTAERVESHGTPAWPSSRKDRHHGGMASAPGPLLARCRHTSPGGHLSQCGKPSRPKCRGVTSTRKGGGSVQHLSLILSQLGGRERLLDEADVRW